MAVKKRAILVVIVLINISISICQNVTWAKNQTESLQAVPNDWPSSFNRYLIDFCVLQGTIKDTIISIYNSSSDTATIDSIVPNQPWLSVSVNPPYGSPPLIIPPNDSVPLTLTIDAASLPCSAYQVNWIVYHNFGIDSIRGNFAVYSSTESFYTRKTQIIECNGVRLSISNTGNVGNQDPQAGMYLISDSVNFLYDGSSVLATILNSGDTIAARDVFSEVQLHPLYNPATLEDIEVIDTTFTETISFEEARELGRPAKLGSWRIARVWYGVYLPSIDTACPWPGPWLGYWINDQWWWKIGAQYKWVIWYRKIYKAPPPCWWPRWSSTLIVNNIYAGTVIDWDVPSDSGVINDGTYNDVFLSIYQYGRGIPYQNYYAATAALVDTAYGLRTRCSGGQFNPSELYGAHLLSNAKYIYGIVDKELYNWVSDSGVQHDFYPYEDISSILSSICFDTSKDTSTYIQGLAVTTKGSDSLNFTVAEMRWSMDLPTQLFEPDLYMAADANHNGKHDLPDIVLLVNYVFKGGPIPCPPCTGDANNTNTINLADIMILVNHIFRGGPKPAKDVDGPCFK